MYEFVTLNLVNSSTQRIIIMFTNQEVDLLKTTPERIMVMSSKVINLTQNFNSSL